MKIDRIEHKKDGSFIAYGVPNDEEQALLEKQVLKSVSMGWMPESLNHENDREHENMTVAVISYATTHYYISSFTGSDYYQYIWFSIVPDFAHSRILTVFTHDGPNETVHHVYAKDGKLVERQFHNTHLIQFWRKLGQDITENRNHTPTPMRLNDGVFDCPNLWKDAIVCGRFMVALNEDHTITVFTNEVKAKNKLGYNVFINYQSGSYFYDDNDDNTMDALQEAADRWPHLECSLQKAAKQWHHLLYTCGNPAVKKWIEYYAPSQTGECQLNRECQLANDLQAAQIFWDNLSDQEKIDLYNRCNS